MRAGLRNLRQKNGIFIFRRKVPIPLQPLVKRRELIRSLGRCSAREARVKAAQLWVVTERIFQMLKINQEYRDAWLADDAADLPTSAQIKLFVDTMLAGIHFTTEFLAAGPHFSKSRTSSPVEPRVLARFLQAKRLRQSLVDNDFNNLDARVVLEDVQKLSKELNIPIAAGSIGERMIWREMARHKADYYDQFARRECKEHGVPELTDIESVSADELEARLREWSETGNESTDERTVGCKTASQVWHRFLADQALADMKERPEKLTSSLNLWIGFHGDTPVADWTGEKAHDLRRFFFTLPRKYAQAEKWKKHPTLNDIAAAFQDEIAAAETAEEKQALQATATRATTWNRHRATLAKFWDWAKRNNLIAHSTNPFEELFIKVRQGRKVWNAGSEKRVHWSPEAMEKLFASPLFTGCKSPKRRHIPGTLVVRDALYWAVLIIAYTGMRREEICQLRVEHLCEDQENGVWYFDLKAEGLNLKDTAQEDDDEELSAKRWVPIPDALIKLDIIGCLHERRDPKEQLFPELRPSGQDKKFGTKVGRDFERYRKNYDQFCRKPEGNGFVPLYVRLMDLHSFRHNFCTELIDAEIPQAHAEEISGHKSEARRTAFANYDRGRTLPILKDAIDKLQRPVNLIRLLEAVRGSLTVPGARS